MHEETGSHPHISPSRVLPTSFERESLLGLHLTQQADWPVNTLLSAQGRDYEHAIPHAGFVHANLNPMYAGKALY